MKRTLAIIAIMVLTACEPNQLRPPVQPAAAKEHGIRISGEIRVGVVKR